MSEMYWMDGCKVYGWCLNSAWHVSRRYLECVLKVTGGCPDGVLKVSGGSQEGVRKVSGGVL